jgi:hypothetical protein
MRRSNGDNQAMQRTHRASAFLAILAVVALGNAQAQSQEWLGKLKQPPNTIYVDHNGGDPVGDSVASAIRERLSKSKRLTLGSQDSAQLRLMLTSKEVLGRRDLSAMAVVLTTHKPMVIHIFHWVYVVGTDRVAQSAEEIISSVDEVLDKTIRK